MKLKRLNKYAKRIVTNKKFFSGDLKRIPENRIEQYIEPLEKSFELDELDEFLSNVKDKYEMFDVEIDQTVGPKLHKILPLTRRQAADPGLWHYLTVVFQPDFVRHRWEFNNYSYMKKRFLGNVRSWDTNTFSRLWWAAELTKIKNNSEPYESTKTLLGRQSFTRALFDREYSWYKPANSAFISVLKDEKKPVYEEVSKRLNKALSTIKLETLDQGEIEYMIKMLTQEVKG